MAGFQTGKLARGLGQPPRLVQKGLRAGIAASGADEREHHERKDPRRGRRARDPLHHTRRFCGLRPAPFIQLEPATSSEQVQPRQVKSLVLAQRDSGINVTVRLGVPAALDSGIRQQIQRGRFLTDKAQPMSAIEALLEDVDVAGGCSDPDQGGSRGLLAVQAIADLVGACRPCLGFLRPHGDSAQE